MSGKFLVTYATRTGSTPGVAEAIASALQEGGAAVDVLPMQDVTDLSAYDAIVAGSAIQASAWLPDAIDFLRTHQAQLQQKPFAAFLVCMTMALPQKSAQEKVPEFMQAVRELVTPVSEGYFAGTLEVNKIPKDQGRWAFRLSVWMRIWKQGDHRDWDKIRAWAHEIQPLLLPNAVEA